MPELALDFSWTHPAPESLQAAGVQAILCYSRISTPPRSYLVDCVNRGIAVCPIFETAATRSFNGYNAGLADGVAAGNDLAGLAIPEGVTLYVNMADTPNVAGYEAAIADYARGFATSFPATWRLGAYGGYVALQAAQAGAARFERLWGVETWGAPSGTPAAHFDWWCGVPGVVLVQMANIPAPLAGTDTNWIVPGASLGGWGSEPDMTPDEVRAIVDEYLFAPTEYGVSRLDAHTEDYTFKGHAPFPSRFVAALAQSSDFIKKLLGL